MTYIKAFLEAVKRDDVPAIYDTALDAAPEIAELVEWVRKNTAFCLDHCETNFAGKECTCGADRIRELVS